MTPRLARLLSPALAALLLAGCSIELQHSLPEQDANDIYVLLSENGISAKKEKEEGGNEPTYMIVVSKQDASQAAKLLREYSLPRPKAGGFSSVAKGKGMIPTAVEERAIFLDAVGGEVANALNKADGVLEARVIVQIPEKSDLTTPDKMPQPTASAFVKYRATLDGVPPIKEADVKRFVAAAVEGLTPEAVMVIMSEAHAQSADVNPESRMQEILGIKMTAASTRQFKIMVGMAALLILAMAGFTTWNFVRGSGAPARRHPEA